MIIDMKRYFVVIKFVVFLLLVISLEGCTGCTERFNYFLGDRIIELNVKNSQGEYTSIFLKSNGEVLTISTNSNMQYIALQNNCAINYNPIFLYKNTNDTLYLVWWSRDKSNRPQIKTDANILYIFEPGINPELVQDYLSKGFKKFPEDSYHD